MCENMKENHRGESVGQRREAGQKEQTWRPLYAPVFVLRI